jgi:hypothetical protein
VHCSHKKQTIAQTIAQPITLYRFLLESSQELLKRILQDMVKMEKGVVNSKQIAIF